MTAIADSLPAHRIDGVGAGPARIGPNAVIQLGHALRAAYPESVARSVFEAAGHGVLLDHPPTEMIDERVAIDLFRALVAQRSPDDVGTVLTEAGRLTADYIIAHRIPVPVRRLLKILPAPLSGPLLLSAIRRHAWTFAGHGTVSVGAGRPFRIEIADNPLAIGTCAWHRGVFKRMFSVLVMPGAQVRHTVCCDDGAPACRFDILRDGQDKH